MLAIINLIHGKREESAPNSIPTILCKLDTNAEYRTTYESSKVEWEDMESIMRVVSVDVTSSRESKFQSVLHKRKEGDLPCRR